MYGENFKMIRIEKDSIEKKGYVPLDFNKVIGFPEIPEGYDLHQKAKIREIFKLSGCSENDRLLLLKEHVNHNIDIKELRRISLSIFIWMRENHHYENKHHSRLMNCFK